MACTSAPSEGPCVPDPKRHGDPRVARVVTLFEGLVPADLPRLDAVYADDVRFEDPFNEVTGLAELRAIFLHMFASIETPRFTVRDIAAEGDQAFLTWDFDFSSRGRAMQIRGASHLRFGADGRVVLHRDYWDAAEELYEKLPLIGTLMRWLRRRATR